MSWEGTKASAPHSQTVFFNVLRCHVLALYSCMSFNYEARQCISVKLFYQCNCCMQTNILFTARTIASMIYYIEIIVVSRPMIFHNYNTCTSLLQYARTHTYTTINTKDLNVNERATLGGMGFFSCNFIPYDYG